MRFVALIGLFAGLTFGSLFASRASAETCTFSLGIKDGAPDLQIAWTAFKTTKKVEAKGTFPVFDVKTEGKPTSLTAGLMATTVGIDPYKLATGNPGRDQNIVDGFFRKFARQGRISGKIHNAKGSDNSGTFDLIVKMNGKSGKIPMKYERNTTGMLTARGSLNVLDFGLKGALANLNKVCYELHKGEDGVSKTWPDVNFEVTAHVIKTCH